MPNLLVGGFGRFVLRLVFRFVLRLGLPSNRVWRAPDGGLKCRSLFRFLLRLALAAQGVRAVEQQRGDVDEGDGIATLDAFAGGAAVLAGRGSMVRAGRSLAPSFFAEAIDSMAVASYYGAGF
jgi:hypothetical protein